MRILFLTSQFPYPVQSGGALRAYGLIRGFYDHGQHQIHLFSFGQAAPSPLHNWCEEITLVPAPKRRFINRLQDLFLSTRADMSRRFWSTQAAEQLQSLINTGSFDVVHAESIEMAAYFPLLHQRQPSLPLIYGSLNAEADLQRSMFQADLRNRRWHGAGYSWVQWRRLTALEKRICDLSARVIAVSAPDKKLLERLTQTPVTVIENGIDTTAYQQNISSIELIQPAIVLTGTMDYRPNVDAAVWFAQDIFPKILKEHSTAHCYLVGNRPHKRLDALRDHPNLTITGKVTQIEPYVHSATVYIAPLRMGSGTRFKLLEAMASGCAIVSTRIGAQGLGVEQEIVLADTADDFAGAIKQLLLDPAQRKRLGLASQTFVKENFDWSVIIPRLLAAYDTIDQMD